MASEYSESSASLDILTPTFSLVEQPGFTIATEQGPSDASVVVQDDLTRGRELMMEEVEILKVNPPAGLNGDKEIYCHQEILPDDTGKRLDSDICTISINHGRVILKAHHGILIQSPVLRALLRFRDQGKKASGIELPNEEPAVVRRILHYPYAQTLPIASSDKVGIFEQLCDAYILSCKLELDVLADLIITSLNDSDVWTMSEGFACAAYKVYKADQARMPFREFLKERLRTEIRIEGIKENNLVRRSVEALVTFGGTIALDVAQVLMQISEDSDEKRTPRTDLGEAPSTNLQETSALAQKQADPELRNAEGKPRAMSQEVEVAEVTSEDETATSQCAKQELDELVDRAVAAETELCSLKKKEAKKENKGKSKKRAKTRASERADKLASQEVERPYGLSDEDYWRMSEEKMDEETDGEEEVLDNDMEDEEGTDQSEGIVAIALKCHSPTSKFGLALEVGDRITNIRRFPIGTRGVWEGISRGRRGTFDVGFLTDPSVLFYADVYPVA